MSGLNFVRSDNPNVASKQPLRRRAAAAGVEELPTRIATLSMVISVGAVASCSQIDRPRTLLCAACTGRQEPTMDPGIREPHKYRPFVRIGTVDAAPHTCH